MEPDGAHIDSSALKEACEKPWNMNQHVNHVKARLERTQTRGWQSPYEATAAVWTQQKMRV